MKMPTSSTLPWTYRSDALPPDSGTSVFVLSENSLTNRDELERFRREFPHIEEGFSDKRVRELYLGRTAAQAAIKEKFGIDPGWIPIGAAGLPSLPRGVRASLSHSTIDGVSIAAVAIGSEPEVLGVDFEPILNAETARKLERRFSERLPKDAQGPQAMTELFTIYETVVKIACQLGHGKPGPSQIDLIERASDHWIARLNTDGLEVISGVFIPAFPATHSRLTLGWWDRKRTENRRGRHPFTAD
jgi:4'-phosphopantetheinyl transferase EntD